MKKKINFKMGINLKNTDIECELEFQIFNVLNDLSISDFFP